MPSTPQPQHAWTPARHATAPPARAARGRRSPAPPGCAGCAASASRPRGRRAPRPRRGRRRSRPSRSSPARGGAPRPARRSRWPSSPLVDSASSASPGAAVGDHLAREDRLDADVVGDRGQDRGSSVRSSAAAGQRARARSATDVHRVGRRAAVAERQQPAAGVEAARSAARRRDQRRRAPSVSVCARSSPTSSAFISTERAHVVDAPRRGRPRARARNG